MNLIEGGTTVPHGTLLFIERLMFVDREVVSRLNKEYSYLESGPLLPSPWYRSQFLSHAYDLLSDREEFTYMTEYMNMTQGLGQYAEGLRKCSFSKCENFHFGLIPTRQVSQELTLFNCLS